MTPALNANQVGTRGQGPGGKYLVFVLEGRRYGLDILCIREIVGNRSLIPANGSTPHLKGLISLGRGMVPVFDLRANGTCHDDEDAGASCTIIAVTEGRQLGIVAHKVLDVYDIADGEILREGVPGGCVPERFILGVARTPEGEVILLDIAGVIEEGEVRGDFLKAGSGSDKT